MAIGDKKPVVMEYDRGMPGGVATLGADGILAEDQRPGISQIEGLESALSEKQPTLTGTPGQLVGISDDGVAQATVYPSNKNLLDNWYFIGGGSQQGGGHFPINQRGGTEYTAKGNNEYCLDRWYLTRATNQIIINADSIDIINNGSNSYLNQKIPNMESFIGKTLTFSVLYDTNKLKSVTVVIPDATQAEIATEKTDGKYISIASDKTINCVIVSIGATNSNVGKKINVSAAKLELGDQQTLSHQENGQWVLNDPPPNYALELAKCQRYQFVFPARIRLNPVTVSGSAMDFFVPFPETFRTVPSISSWELTNAGGAVQTGWNMTVLENPGNGLYIRVAKSSHGMDYTALLVLYKGDVIDANL